MLLSPRKNGLTSLFKEVRVFKDTPPISIAILLQKYALLLAESSIYTTTLYHDTPPICIAILFQEYSGQGSLEHPQ